GRATTAATRAAARCSSKAGSGSAWMAWLRATISSRAFATAAARRDFASAKGAAGVALRSTVTRDSPCGDRDGRMARSVGESDAPAAPLLHGQGRDRLEDAAWAEHGRC